ncbi:uncharacterized iron-regulated protein [Burkholderiales bacterium JOSHI_001]|nr:uncharacterized iron-regulated protein [Burkholderiales bacterium JOSHI_001]
MPCLHRLHPRLTLALLALMGACATPIPLPPPPAGTRALVFGEQHDQPDHQQQVAQVVAQLAQQGRLAAVVLEMADRGRTTAALPRDATDAAVRDALAWTSWPWGVYADVVMGAVRAGVPVLGGNLPRASTRATMNDASLDDLIDATVRQHLVQAVRDGHCGQLPPAREPGMVRVQTARDDHMARTLEEAAAQAAPGQVVLLLTGMQHASRDRGVPWHLQRRGQLGAAEVHVVAFGPAVRNAGLAVDHAQPARRVERPDPCVGLGDKLLAPPAAASAAASAAR